MPSEQWYQFARDWLTPRKMGRLDAIAGMVDAGISDRVLADPEHDIRAQRDCEEYAKGVDEGTRLFQLRLDVNGHALATQIVRVQHEVSVQAAANHEEQLAKVLSNIDRAVHEISKEVRLLDGS